LGVSKYKLNKFVTNETDASNLYDHFIYIATLAQNESSGSKGKNWDPKFDKYFEIHEKRIANGEKLHHSRKQ